MAQGRLTVCTWPGCDRGGPIRRGYCDLHYLRWRRHGDPSKGHRSPGEARAFVEAAAASSTDDCILWPYPLLDSGYGQLAVNGRRWTAHRLALVMASGVDRDGMHAAHGDCHNRACINPRHLYWATPSGNAADKVRDGTSQRGHRAGRAKLTEADVYSIRSALADGEYQTVVAARFGVSQTTISSIATGQTWGWLT